MKKIIYYIGSNNETKELESEKAINIASQYYEGMSISQITWFRKWERENTLVISTVVDEVDTDLINKLSKQICLELEQQAVMVEIVDTNTQFIS